MLKFLSVLVIAFVLGIVHSQIAELHSDAFHNLREEHRERVKECMGNHTVGEGNVTETRQEAWKRLCVRECIMKKTQTMDANGKLNKTRAIELLRGHSISSHLHLPAAIELFTNCSEIKVSENPCEAAEQYAQCIRNGDHANSTHAHHEHHGIRGLLGILGIHGHHAHHAHHGTNATNATDVTAIVNSTNATDLANSTAIAANATEIANPTVVANATDTSPIV